MTSAAAYRLSSDGDSSRIPTAGHRVARALLLLAAFHLAHALLDLVGLLSDDHAARVGVDEAVAIQETLGAATLRNQLTLLGLPTDAVSERAQAVPVHGAAAPLKQQQTISTPSIP